MIGRLRGVLVEKHPPALCVDVAGVGYELEASMNTCSALPELGSEVQLYTHQLIREDAHLLYGFVDTLERETFRALIKVNGVGAKLALAILSGMDPPTFRRCISAGDSASLTRLPGIGKKTAERLIVEMRDRFDAMPNLVEAAGHATARRDDPEAEAVSALIALGFKPPEASKRVQAVRSDGMPCEEIVRQALRSMA